MVSQQMGSFLRCMDRCVQRRMWRDTFANAREHEETGKVPRLVFENEEKPVLAPLRSANFDTDDLETTGVGKTHRVHFDRNDYTAPWRLHGQTVLVRATGDFVHVWLSTKEVARHRRCWSVREDIQDERHEDGVRGERGPARRVDFPRSFAR